MEDIKRDTFDKVYLFSIIGIATEIYYFLNAFITKIYWFR